MIPSVYSDSLELVMELMHESAVLGIFTRATFKGSDAEFDRLRSEWVGHMGHKIDRFAERHGTKPIQDQAKREMEEEVV